MRRGISFLGALTLIFIILRLIGAIDWSWWWVLSPLWVPSAMCLAVAIFFFIVWLLAMIISALAAAGARRVRRKGRRRG